MSCSDSDLVLTIIQLIPAVDWATDALVVVNAVVHGHIMQDIMFFVGFVMFSVSQGIRLLHEGGYFKHRDKIRCFYLGCFFVAIPWAFFVGALVVLERLVRIALSPLDPFLGLGYYSATKGEIRFLVATSLFCLTREERDFFLEQNWFLCYTNILTSFAAGGRWQAMVYWKYKTGLYDDAAETIPQEELFQARRANYLAILEELVENAGGLIMSVALLLQNGEIRGNRTLSVSTILALVSIGSTAISGTVETGYFIGRLNMLGKRHDRNRGGEPDDTSTEDV